MKAATAVAAIPTPRPGAAGIRRIGSVVLVLLAASALVSCSKDAPPPPPQAPAQPVPPPQQPPAAAPAAVAGVSIGRSVGADKKIAAPTDTFGQKDTVYASVETTGVGKSTPVKVKWTFTDKNGKVVPVHEETQTLDLNGPATHEFHVSKKTPWPKGTYNVEISLNDMPAAKKPFVVN
jgi:hypothetical protein